MEPVGLLLVPEAEAVSPLSSSDFRFRDPKLENGFEKADLSDFEAREAEKRSEACRQTGSSGFRRPPTFRL